MIIQKNVDIALIGIPCVPYTKANINLTKALINYENGIATEKEMKLVRQKEDAETMTFFVLEAIRAMNVNTVIIEEVVEYSKTEACQWLRVMLKKFGYHISETIATGSHSKRKRWALVANMNKKINLENLIPNSNKTIEDLLETPIDKREWKTIDEVPRVLAASKKIK